MPAAFYVMLGIKIKHVSAVKIFFKQILNLCAFLELALSANSKDVIIYTKTAGKWIASNVLSEHTSKVLGIDWAPNSNQIVTCGAVSGQNNVANILLNLFIINFKDKNAYVWKFDVNQKTWKPELVVLRINRAATCCKWSPNGLLFNI